MSLFRVVPIVSYPDIESKALTQIMTTSVYSALFGEARYENTKGINPELVANVSAWKACQETFMLYSDFQNRWTVPYFGFVDYALTHPRGPSSLLRVEFCYADVVSGRIVNSQRTSVQKGIDRPATADILDDVIVLNPRVATDSIWNRITQGFVGFTQTTDSKYAASNVSITDALLTFDTQGDDCFLGSSEPVLLDRVSLSNQGHYTDDPRYYRCLAFPPTSSLPMPTSLSKAALVQQGIAPSLRVGNVLYDASTVFGSEASISFGNDRLPVTENLRSTTITVRLDDQAPALLGVVGFGKAPVPPTDHAYVNDLAPQTQTDMQYVWAWDTSSTATNRLYVCVAMFSNDVIRVSVDSQFLARVISVDITGIDGTLLGSTQHASQEGIFYFVPSSDSGAEDLTPSSSWMQVTCSSTKPARIALQTPLALYDRTVTEVFWHASSGVLTLGSPDLGLATPTIRPDLLAGVVSSGVVSPGTSEPFAWLALSPAALQGLGEPDELQRDPADDRTILRVEGWTPTGITEDGNDIVTLAQYEFHIGPSGVKVCNSAAGLWWNPYASGYEFKLDKLTALGPGGASTAYITNAKVDVNGQTTSASSVSVLLTQAPASQPYCVYRLNTVTDNRVVFRLESADLIAEFHVNSTLTISFADRVPSTGGSFSMRYVDKTYEVPHQPSSAHTLATSYSMHILPRVDASFPYSLPLFGKFVALTSYLIAKRGLFVVEESLVSVEVTRCSCASRRVSIDEAGYVSNLIYDTTVRIAVYKEASRSLITDTYDIRFTLPPPLIRNVRKLHNATEPLVDSWFAQTFASKSLPTSGNFRAVLDGVIPASSFV